MAKRPPIHIAISFDDLKIEEECPCTKLPCGFVDVFSASKDCEYHGPFKTAPMRRHLEADCPGAPTK